MREPTITPATLLVVLTTFLLSTSSVWAQPSPVGTISGNISDEAAQPVVWANVIVENTPWGTMSLDDGTYVIRDIPVGTYTVRIESMGHSDKWTTGIQVVEGQTATIDFVITEQPVEQLPEMTIVANRKKLEKGSRAKHDIDGDVVDSLPILDMEDAISLIAGVVVAAGEMHFRGSRAGEVAVTIDGVPMKDPQQGSNSALATMALESTETILGGMDAEYGNAQSGVINYRTREGGQDFSGRVFYLTDDYGQPDNTYDNLDRIFVGVGGPSPIDNLTYYGSIEGTFADSYPSTPRDRNHRRVLNFVSIGDRKQNSIRAQGKLALRTSRRSKLTVETIYNKSRSDTYHHMWSRVGYVETFRDTSQTGNVSVRRGAWSPTQIDDSYEYYNPSNHTPTSIDRFNQLKFVWTQTVNESSHYNVKLSRNFFYADQRVSGKNAWEYDGVRESDFWFNYADGETEEFFVLTGDYPILSHRETIVYTAKSDYTKRYNTHTFKAGFEASYNNMSYSQVDRPYATNVTGQIGETRTQYHYYNPEGAVYVQDRWEHEGMILNFGLRYDIFSVGDQLDITEVRDPVKGQVSPRIGIAYPISDRDVFSFHYGRFYQIPERQYLFDNRYVLDGRTQGNPNLSNETTVSYQAGIQHLFNEAVSGQFWVYYKDIFGLLTTESRRSLGSVDSHDTYVNRDYASARGFEATLSRSFANNFSGELNYGFGVATGVASDPNALAEQAFAYRAISEQPLNWDVRHSLSAQAAFSDPGNWLASLVWRYSSGLPYTPYSRDTRELNPQLTNSRRRPATTSLDVRAEKLYQLWGQDLKVFLQSRNVLDARNITSLSPLNWPPPPGRSSTDYVTYFAETGRAGGAYVGDDVDGDGQGNWVPLNDPRVFGDPRNVQMGVQFTF